MFHKMTSSQIEILKWIGIVSMLSDHIGVLFCPEIMELRAFGRLAYPLFGYVLIHNYIFFSQNKLKYIKRLLLLAFISEPFHYMTFIEHYAGVNIFFMYSLVLASIYLIEGSYALLEKEKFKKELTSIIFVGFFVLSLFIEYDIRGYLLLLSFYYIFKNGKKFIFLLSFFILATLDAPYLPFILSSLFVFPLIFLMSKARVPSIPRNKLFFYLFYPVHICILFIFNQ